MGEFAWGLESARVAEVLVARTDSLPGRRGSGYRVADAYVLTAAHVIADPAASVRVRFGADQPGEWSSPARSVLLAETADVALLELTDVPDAHRHVRPPRYAAVPDSPVTLSFTAVGFPRFKLRRGASAAPDDGSPSQYRDTCHLSGTISVLSNRREGTLELAVLAPAGAPEPGRSPWEGMSGAAVWCDGALTGMVSAHHLADGLGRLAAVRVERWYAALSTVELALLAQHAGLPPLDELSPADGPAGPVPLLSRLPSDVPLRDLAELVDALTELPTLRSPGGMALVLESISSQIAANSPRDPRLRMDIFGIVRTCLRYPGTLDQLLEAVRLFEGPSSTRESVDRAAERLARGRH
ncbi:trypsin-like peptidase domain-containing protein [Streptomyces sp. NPDC050548]|uniref:effector-associated domain 2-containing protein n=1 Tax=Streptomyces sp. NPDC050548 TaxID=3365629 RepID=UPI00378DA600